MKAFTTSSKGIEPIWSVSLFICIFRFRVPKSTISMFWFLSTSIDSAFSTFPSMPAITGASQKDIEKPMPPASPPFVFFYPSRVMAVESGQSFLYQDAQIIGWSRPDSPPAKYHRSGRCYRQFRCKLCRRSPAGSENKKCQDCYHQQAVCAEAF
jgi:hypothetical protein